MHEPLVSVVMSVHNEQQLVADAIKSILRQDYAHLELIIVDDYSTDNSVQICRSFTDPRVRVAVKQGEPRYLAASRNIGVAMARGEYVTFQDADDVCNPARLRMQLQLALQDPGRTVAGCSILRIRENLSQTWTMPAEHDQIVRGFHRTFNRTTIVGATLLGPTQAFRRTPYRESFRYMQDWDQLLRMYESGEVRFCNATQPLYTYIIRPKGVLNNPLWLDYNILVRHCQHRRRAALPELLTPEALADHLRRHPLEHLWWGGLKSLIKMRNCKPSNNNTSSRAKSAVNHLSVKPALTTMEHPRRHERPT